MKHEENELQAAVIQYLNLVPQVMAFHPKNEGASSIQQRMRDKSLGVRSGVPDLVLLCSDGKTRYIELKTDKGKLSEAQERFRDKCLTWGIDWALCRSVDDVANILKQWL